MKIRLCAFADEAAADLGGQIEALKRNNIKLIEIRNVDGQNVADMSLKKAEDIFAELRAADISVWSIGSPIGKVSITDSFCDEQKRLLHILQICKIFECKRVRMFSFFTDEYQKYSDTVVENLCKLVELAKEYDVELYHENEKDIYGDTCERVEELLDRVKGLKSIYDPANFLQVGEKADKTISRLLHRADYLHIKDVIFKSGELVPAGHGDGQIDKIVSLLNSDKILTIEPHLRIFEGYENTRSNDMMSKFNFASSKEAFDTAVSAIKQILINKGFNEGEGEWIK